MTKSGEAAAAGTVARAEGASRPAPEQKMAAEYLDLWERALREALLHGPGVPPKTPG